MRRLRRSHFDVVKKENSMASMIDVVFLLLIFFLVVNKPIESKTLFDTSLPGKSNKIMSTAAPLAIDVTKLAGDPNGEWYKVRHRYWRLNDLKPMLGRLVENDPEMSLIINCGPNAKHAKLIHLLDVCSDAGVVNFNLVNDSRIPFRKNNDSSR